MKWMVFLVLLLLGLKLDLLIALLEHPFRIQKHSAFPGSLVINTSAKHVVVVNRKGGGGGGGGGRSAGGGGRPGGRVGTFPVNGGGANGGHRSGSDRLFRSTFSLYVAVLLFTGFSTALVQFL